jgi:hypothetical protein
MNKPQEWETAFSIYQQARDIPGFDNKFKTNERVRKEILSQIQLGISELEQLGEQRVSNIGRRLYNEFTGTQEYKLVEATQLPLLNPNSREIIQAFVRHGEASRDKLTTVGVIEAISAEEKLKEVYAGRNPKVYTSPSNRTYQTGEIIAESLEVQAEKREELSLDSSSLENFVNSIKEDSVFVSHLPNLEKVCKRHFDHGEVYVVRRKI